ncbi:MAG: hypothetical protein ACRDFB_10525 [Rhabdochlamydiaceae bacterium]
MGQPGRPLKPLKKENRGRKDVKNNLYPRERLVLRKLINNEVTHIDEAIEQVYDVTSKGSVDAMRTRLTRRERFIKALEKAGVTDEKLSNTYIKGLEAKRPVVTKEGVFEYPDWQARHAFAKTASQIKQHFVEDQHSEDKLEPLIVNLVQFKDNTISINKDND